MLKDNVIIVLFFVPQYIAVQGFGQKVVCSAISPLFADDRKCIEMLPIYEIEMRGLYGLPIF